MSQAVLTPCDLDTAETRITESAPAAAVPKRKIDARDILPTVQMIRRRLQPHCQKIVIAGSLRRQRQEVGDAEIVILPKWDLDIFGDPAETYGAIDAEIARLVSDGCIALDPDVKRNGPRYKRFLLLNCQSVPLELFFADERNWGNQLAIRTGPASFNQVLVTKRRMGGLMPNHMRQNEGYLRLGDEDDAEIVPCPTEAAFFKAICISDVPAPEKRTGELAGAMAKVVNRR